MESLVRWIFLKPYLPYTRKERPNLWNKSTPNNSKINFYFKNFWHYNEVHIEYNSYTKNTLRPYPIEPWYIGYQRKYPNRINNYCEPMHSSFYNYFFLLTDFLVKMVFCLPEYETHRSSGNYINTKERTKKVLKI